MSVAPGDGKAAAGGVEEPAPVKAPTGRPEPGVAESASEFETAQPAPEAGSPKAPAQEPAVADAVKPKVGAESLLRGSERISSPLFDRQPPQLVDLEDFLRPLLKRDDLVAVVTAVLAEHGDRWPVAAERFVPMVTPHPVLALAAAGALFGPGVRVLCGADSNNGRQNPLCSIEYNLPTMIRLAADQVSDRDIIMLQTCGRAFIDEKITAPLRCKTIIAPRDDGASGQDCIDLDVEDKILARIAFELVRGEKTWAPSPERLETLIAGLVRPRDRGRLFDLLNRDSLDGFRNWLEDREHRQSAACCSCSGACRAENTWAGAELIQFAPMFQANVRVGTGYVVLLANAGNCWRKLASL